MVVSAQGMSTNYHEIIASWLNFAQFWLLPPVCIGCRQPGQPGLDLCAACKQALLMVENPCPACALPLPPGHAPGTCCGACLKPGNPVDRTVAPYAWEEPVAGFVSSFKYRGKGQYGKVLCSLLALHLDSRYQSNPLPDALVPVPLHPSRLKERGFNQARVLADQLGRALAIPVHPDLVHRTRPTLPQQGLGARERRRNLGHAFAVKGALPRDIRRIAIIDDVCTTMTTVKTIARLLHRHSPHPLEIHVWALARA
jgi:ComF family protein